MTTSKNVEAIMSWSRVVAAVIILKVKRGGEGDRLMEPSGEAQDYLIDSK